MDIGRLRAWWANRQGLDGGLAALPPAEALERTGWMRSVGGAGPYLGLFARCGAGRAAVDRATAEQELQELPAARGCTYIVPRRDCALALRVGQAFASGDRKQALKLGVPERELDRLSAAVLDALRGGALKPDELRQAIGGAARDLGEAGRKRGMTTTLPAALETLQSQGEIRRIPLDGRLDRERYRYELWRPNPLAQFRLSREEAYTELARRYFEWTGPATLAEFQWFSGLGVKAARDAAAPLGLRDLGEGRLIAPERAADLEAFRAPSRPCYALASSLDGIVLLRRNLASLVEPGDMALIPGGSAGLKDLPSHAILDRGRLAGLWEFDPEKGELAWASFAPPDAALREAVARMERYVREDLGDARSFSLDSPKSRMPRIEGLRALAARATPGGSSPRA